MLTFLCLFTSLHDSSFACFGREHVTSSKLFHSAYVQPPEFGLCSSPCCRFPEEEGHSCPFYLDDFLLLAATMEEAVKNTQLVVTLFSL